MKNEDRRIIVADFETSTETWYEKDGYARVWLWGLYDIEEDKFEHGIDIESFLNRILRKDPRGNPVYYFHNLKFDGSYIVNYLLSHDFHYDEDLSFEGTFRTCISDMGMWYYIEICIYKHKKQKYIVKIQDSLKKIPMPVRDIPESFGFTDEQKGELDYDTYRPIGHEPTEQELDYLLHDCKLVARALRELNQEGFTKMTTAGDAFEAWKKTLQTENARRKGVRPDTTYRHYYPELPLAVDDYIRRAYRGGWTYVNPRYAGYIINKHIQVWDINSMYPHKMKCRYLPVGEPIFFTGKPQPTKYQCYICRILVSFEIKKGFLPTIQLKNSFLFNPTDYIESSKGQEVEMILTNIDMKLLFKHYNVTSITYLDGYYFRKVTGIFAEHIDTNMKIKETSTGGRRYVAKLRMNTVYGRTATSPRKKQKIPYLEDGVLKFTFSEENIEESQYTALGVFITSWARHDIITDAQNNYENFIYCDTDSLHMLANEDGTDPNLPIHPTHLGYYKLEHNCTRGLYLRSKTYVEEYDDGQIEIKCAGASPEVKKGMNFENFKVGGTFTGKLMPKQVKGGCILKRTTFTIK